MCSRVGALQKIDFFFKVADFSVLVNISVKIKFQVMQMLLWPTKLDENKALTKIFTQSYTKIWTWKCGSIVWNLRKSWKTKIFHFPVQKLKFVTKAFVTWFSSTYMFIPHWLSNPLLVMWSQWFFQENKSEENGCLDATYLEPKPSFFIFFLSVARLFFNFAEGF